MLTFVLKTIVNNHWVLTLYLSTELICVLYSHTTCTTLSTPFSNTYSRFSVIKHCSSNLALENCRFWSLETQLFINKSSPPQSRNLLHNQYPSLQLGTAHALHIMSNILSITSYGDPRCAYSLSKSTLMVFSRYKEYFCIAFSTSALLAKFCIISRSSNSIFKRLSFTHFIMMLAVDILHSDKDMMCEDLD
ncbi:hypothetical protein AGLY_001192 [Aphis glycines]|uniref:Uncharacterized protein n=1 Tax=Aphis glycines TaxID=307491 RepID=A0A6G0UAK4_APHGL|nr:hypothetical protein AGLY_001192 [Aphis glycines]